MASNITVDSITKGATTVNTDEIVDTNSSQACKAWVNFNGTGTVAITDSYNVSSITDISTGKYNINFTTALSNANYSASGTNQGNASVRSLGTLGSSSSGTFTTSGFWYGAYSEGVVNWEDPLKACVQVFGN